MKEQRKFWRNSRVNRSSLLVIALKYIVVIPLAPCVAYLILTPRRRYGRSSDTTYIIDYIKQDPSLFLVVTLSVGALIWLWTIKAQLKPLFQLDTHGLKYSGLGFANSQISFASVSIIKPYNIFPLGTLIDMKSSIGSNVRFFGFVSRVDKQELRKFLADTDIQVE